MLTPKPWRPEAIVRLILAGLVCLFASLLVVSWVYYFPGHGIRAVALCVTAGAVACICATLFFLRKPWTYDELPLRFISVTICFCALLLLSGWAFHIAGSPPEKSSGLQMVLGEGLLLVIIAAFLKEHQIGWGEAFGLTNHVPQAALFGVVAGSLLVPIGYGLQLASAFAMKGMHLEPHEQPAIQVLRLSQSGPERLWLGALAVLVAPVVEEIAFRGILYPAVKEHGFPRLALWGSALLFAGVHANLPTFLPLLVLALVLTLLYEKTDNLLASILAHAMFNGVNFLEFIREQSSG